jgi:hypothetical protein
MRTAGFTENAQVLLFLCVLLACMQPKAFKHIIRGGFTMLSGRTSDRKTNSTFFRRGNKVLDPSGRAGKWSMLAGWERATYRAGAAIAFLGFMDMRTNHPTALRVVGILIVTVAVTATVFFGNIHLNKRKLSRGIVMPIHRTLAPIVEQYAHITPTQWIDVPDDYATNASTRVVIHLPQEFPATTEQRRAIPPIVAAKLGGEWDSEFNMKGKDPRLIMRPAPQPPDSIRLSQLVDAMDRAPEHAPILGVGSHEKIISADLNSDSPHIALSMGSGGGKSTAVRALAIQLLRNGAEVEIIDIAKRGVSHLWGKRIEGVSIWRTAETAHNALVRLGKEMEGRYEEIYIDPTREGTFTRRIVIFEEVNASFKMLTDYWKTIKTKEDPKDSPAVTAFANMLFAGRQGRMNVIAVAQSFSARAIGGPESRENFAIRILGRYSVNAWKMLAPEVWPAPRSSRHVGRVQMVTGGEAFATQVLYTTDEEAYAYATSRPRTRQPVVTTVTTEHVANARVYTLAEAVREEIIPAKYNYDTAKKIRQRNPSFPEMPATAEAITEWFANYPGGK